MAAARRRLCSAGFETARTLSGSRAPGCPPERAAQRARSGALRVAADDIELLIFYAVSVQSVTCLTAWPPHMGSREIAARGARCRARSQGASPRAFSRPANGWRRARSAVYNSERGPAANPIHQLVRGDQQRAPGARSAASVRRLSHDEGRQGCDGRDPDALHLHASNSHSGGIHGGAAHVGRDFGSWADFDARALQRARRSAGAAAPPCRMLAPWMDS